MNAPALILRLAMGVVFAYSIIGVLVTDAAAENGPNKARQSIVRIKVLGKSLSGASEPFWGTGFFVSKEGHILTALHTLKPASYWEKKEDEKPNRDIWVQRIDSQTNTLNSEWVPAQFNEVDQIPGKDVALIKIPGTGYKEVRCRKSEPLLQSKTYHRLGYINVQSQPELSSRPAKRADTIENLKPRYTFLVESKKGMSGGPIVDGRGVVRAYITSGPDEVDESKVETYGLHVKGAESLLPDGSRCKGGLKIEDGTDDSIESETDLTALLNFSELHYLKGGKSARFRSIFVFGNYTNRSLSTLLFGTAINMGTFESYSVSARKIPLRDHGELSRRLGLRQQLDGQELGQTANLFDQLFDTYGKSGEEIGYFRYQMEQGLIKRGGDVVRLIGGNTEPRIEGIPEGIGPISDSDEEDKVVVVCLESRASLDTDLTKEGRFGHLHLYDTQRSIMLARVDGSLSIDPSSVKKKFEPEDLIPQIKDPLISASTSAMVLDSVNLPKLLKATLAWGWGQP